MLADKLSFISPKGKDKFNKKKRYSFLDSKSKNSKTYQNTKESQKN